MSEQNNTKREKFQVKVSEPLQFDAIASVKFITSDELCKLTSELFKSVFADWEGCQFETDNQGMPYLSFIFNHGEYDKDAVVACERFGAKSTGSNVLDRTRGRDNLLAKGDRYYLTDDGKDVVKDLLIYREYNNGNPNYGRIVSEMTDRSIVNQYMQGQSPQYTKVSFISLDRIAALLFGTKVDNDIKEYSVRIGASMPQPMMGGMQMAPKFMLQIMRASTNEVQEVYKKCGWTTVGSNIVR